MFKIYTNTRTNYQIVRTYITGNEMSLIPSRLLTLVPATRMNELHVLCCIVTNSLLETQVLDIYM